MKNISILILSAAFVMALISCGADKAGTKNAARESLAVPATSTPAPSSIPAPTSSVNTNVPHYKCPNNCIGSGGAGAGTCPVCGTEYVHNDAYHNNSSAPATTTSPIATTTPGAAAGTPVTPSTPEPPQNAAGVWHYTCSNGCAGGAGSATACATCGTTLAHNPAYHN